MARKTARPARTAPLLAVVPTGVPGLDEILGGGLPEHSFNLIAGGPGSGKTTLAMQILCAVATPERPGLYITLLGESSVKMMRYQQGFRFFDPARVGSAIHFLNLAEEANSGDLDAALHRIVEEIDRLQPGLIVVDSFRSLVRAHDAPAGYLEQFVQQLAMHLTASEITAILIGEYPEEDLRAPVFTVADGILWLSQSAHRSSVVRRLQVVKSRGMATMPGLHTLRISDAGMQLFPRTPVHRGTERSRPTSRLSTGITGLDQMMGGGIPAGDSVVLAGPAGTGKTTFAMRFIAAGLQAGESAVIVIFEEHPEAYLDRARSVDVDLRAAIDRGVLRIIYLRPLDLSVDETLDEVRLAVEQLGATRVVIDSLSGFEMALAPAFRDDFRESLYRLIGALTGLGVTMFSTVEVIGREGSTGLQFTGHQVSFLTDDILSQRYVELEGELQKAVVVVKMRGSAHSREFRRYSLTATGVSLGESLRDYDGVITGMPTRQARAPLTRYGGLTAVEVLVYEALVERGRATALRAAKQSGVSPEVITGALARLLELGYVTRSGTHYTAGALPGPGGPGM
jgi:circadian clock protein KaiC